MTTSVAARKVFDGDELVAEVTRAALDFRYFLKEHVYIADRSPQGQLIGVLKWEWWEGTNGNPPLHDEVCEILEHPNLREVWLKARQEGFSWLLAAWMLHGAMFTPNFLGGVVSAGQTEAAEFLNKASFIRAHLPYSTIPTLTTENKSELRFKSTNGAIMAFPSTPDAGRGYTFSRWVTDEAAFHEHALANYEAYSIAAEYGQIVIVSSAGTDEAMKVANPWFQTFWSSARDGINGFTARFFSYARRPGRDAAWYARESMRLSGRPGAMAREFPATPEEAFRSMLRLRFDTTAIDEGIAYARSTKPVQAVYGLPPALLGSGHLTVWNLPRPGIAYVLGIDGAEGKGLDYTVTHVLEARTLRHVASLRENVLEPSQHGVFSAALAKYYNDGWCMVERSHGEAILIQLSLAGCKVYREEPREVRYGATLGIDDAQRLGTPGFPMTAATRPGIIDDLAEVIHDRTLTSPDPNFWGECGVAIVTDKGRTEAAAGQHDDSWMAMGLAVRMARQPGASVVRSTSWSGSGPNGQRRSRSTAKQYSAR